MRTWVILKSAAVCLMFLMANPISSSEVPPRPAHGAAIETRSAPLALPPRLPDNPEFLVRAIYLMPLDRQPADPEEYAAKVAKATLKIQTALETLSDFYAYDQERFNIAVPGKGVNFERDEAGHIRVIVLNGRLVTEGAEGYWGSDEGTNSGATFYRVISDIFGSLEELEAVTAKTIFMVFPDTLRLDSSVTPTAYRGYMGYGYGRLAMVPYNMLHFMATPVNTSREARIQSLAETFCCTDTTVTIDDFTGCVYEGPPVEWWKKRCLMKAEQASISLGVMAHEMGHTFGMMHDHMTPDAVMQSGFARFGAACRIIYNLPDCPEVVLSKPPEMHTQLGEGYAHFLSRSPFFNPETPAETTPPDCEIAWPPAGWFLTDPPYRITVWASDSGGSGLYMAQFHNYEGCLFDFKFFEGRSTLSTPYDGIPWNLLIGRRFFWSTVQDNAGNSRMVSVPVIGMRYTENVMGSISGNTYWVRRPPAEDSRPRNAAAPLGSFHNPYSDIITATNDRLGKGDATIMIGRGLWQVTASIPTGYYLSFSGEGVGETILDGQGGSHSLFKTDAFIQESTITNLVLRNAGAGITPGNYESFHVYITNCLFYNLKGYAIDIPWLAGIVNISQNTVIGCGGGIRLQNYHPYVADNLFLFRNNLVGWCGVEGIRLDNIQTLRGKGGSGYNLSYGSTTDFIGNGEGAGGSPYSIVRLPGEISADPSIMAIPPVSPADLKLKDDSPAIRGGDPRTVNEDGTRRDIGAWLGNRPANIASRWQFY